MTVEHKKRLLRQYVALDERICRLMGERDRWQQLKGRIDSPTVTDIDQSLCQSIERLHRLRAGIERAIDSLDDPTERSILQLRYIGMEDWELIADAVGYSRRQMFYIHRRALEKLALDEHCTNCTNDDDNMIA